MAKRRRWGSARGRRQALKRNQIAALILHGSLTTTEAKAKVLKREVERLISRAKRADLAPRRRVLAFLPKDEVAEKLFDQIIPQFKGRVGGYVRVVKLPPRRGDLAPMARVEFVEEIKKIKGTKETEATKVTKVQEKEKPGTAKAQKAVKRDAKGRRTQRKSAPAP